MRPPNLLKICMSTQKSVKTSAAWDVHSSEISTADSNDRAIYIPPGKGSRTYWRFLGCSRSRHSSTSIHHHTHRFATHCSLSCAQGYLLVILLFIRQKRPSSYQNKMSRRHVMVYPALTIIVLIYFIARPLYSVRNYFWSLFVSSRFPEFSLDYWLILIWWLTFAVVFPMLLG